MQYAMSIIEFQVFLQLELGRLDLKPFLRPCSFLNTIGGVTCFAELDDQIFYCCIP